MSLTKPFFNTIPAFDATGSNIINFYMLGGSPITSYTYAIYLSPRTENATPVITETVNVTDTVTTDIRSFGINIAANTLSNGSYYEISVTATDGTTTTTVVLSTPFRCAKPPNVDIYVKPTISNTVVPDFRIIGTTLNGNINPNINLGDSVDIKVRFETGTVGVPYIGIQSFRVQLRGYKLNRGSKILFESPIVYDTDTVFTIGGLMGTNVPQAPFDHYWINVEGTTVYGQHFTDGEAFLQFYFNPATDTDAIPLYNENGLIQMVWNKRGTAETVKVERSDANGNTITLMESVPNNSFTLYDPYNANDEMYTYKVTVNNPVLGGGFDTIYYTGIIYSQFCKSYIVDSQKIYDISAELTISNAQRVQQTVLYTPIGRRYPFVGANALTNYRSGSLSTILRAPTSENTGYIDRKAQTALVREFNDWLTNHKPKIFKDINGEIILLFVVDPINNEYMKELGNGIATTSFAWVEIGGINQEDLTRVAMLNDFTVVNN